MIFKALKVDDQRPFSLSPGEKAQPHESERRHGSLAAARDFRGKLTTQYKLLSRVIRINMHVLGRQVAGKELERGFAGSQFDADFIRGLHHGFMGCVVVESANRAAAVERLIADINADARRVDLHAGIADSSQ